MCGPTGPTGPSPNGGNLRVMWFSSSIFQLFFILGFPKKKMSIKCFKLRRLDLTSFDPKRTLIFSPKGTTCSLFMAATTPVVKAEGLRSQKCYRFNGAGYTYKWD